VLPKVYVLKQVVQTTMLLNLNMIGARYRRGFHYISLDEELGFKTVWEFQQV